MVKAKIEYKDGTVENKSFKGYGEYQRYTDKNHAKIRQAECDYVRPVMDKKLMQEMTEDYEVYELRKQ